MTYQVVVFGMAVVPPIIIIIIIIIFCFFNGEKKLGGDLGVVTQLFEPHVQRQKNLAAHDGRVQVSNPQNALIRECSFNPTDSSIVCVPWQLFSRWLLGFAFLRHKDIYTCHCRDKKRKRMEKVIKGER